jgi:hypothetical protein
MDSDRHFKSKRDDRKKERKKKSRSKSSGSRSRSSSSSPYTRKKKGKKSGHEDNEKHSNKHREQREEMPPEDEYRKSMMGFQGYPMMYDMKKMPGFDMGGPMMQMPGMPRVFPPNAFPMPGYPPMMRPPPYLPGMMPPLPNQMDPMMHHKMKMGIKPFPDPKAAPSTKKEKEKTVKKEEESGKVLEFAPPIIPAETLKSLHVSVKHLQEPLFLFSCKKILTEIEAKLKDKKLKSRAKEISEFLSTLIDKIKENEKKDKKKGANSNSNNSEASKISELELVKALNEIEDIKTFLSLVNLEKFSLDECYEPDVIRTTESEDSASLFEDAKALYFRGKNGISQNF